jgi:transposase InsO family protein
MRQHAVDHQVLLSVGRTGVCRDNAMAESFFATFKNDSSTATPGPHQGQDQDRGHHLDQGTEAF